jgi:O-acetyl-ADP-ribose deacetylase (regulator of RNase III)
MKGIVNQIIEKDVTELKAPFILIHLANNKQKMGAGVALSLAQTWPQVLVDLQNAPTDLGSIVVTEVVPNGFVISLIAQKGYGTNRVRINYDYFEECLQKLTPFVNTLKDTPIFAPFHIGCGLAGGNWDTMLGVFAQFPFNITFCKLPSNTDN